MISLANQTESLEIPRGLSEFLSRDQQQFFHKNGFAFPDLSTEKVMPLEILQPEIDTLLKRLRVKGESFFSEIDKSCVVNSEDLKDLVLVQKFISEAKLITENIFKYPATESRLWYTNFRDVNFTDPHRDGAIGRVNPDAAYRLNFMLLGAGTRFVPAEFDPVMTSGVLRNMDAHGDRQYYKNALVAGALCEAPPYGVSLHRMTFGKDARGELNYPGVIHSVNLGERLILINTFRP